MIKLNKNNTKIIAIICFIAGIISLIFYKTNVIFGCLSCLFLAGGFYLIGKHTKFVYQYNLIILDKKLDNMLKDEQQKNEEMQYNKFTKEDKIKFLQKFIKKNKNKDRTFYLFAIVFVIMAIFICL